MTENLFPNLNYTSSVELEKTPPVEIIPEKGHVQPTIPFTKYEYYPGCSKKYCMVSNKLITTPCEPVSIKEGEEIAKILFEFLGDGEDKKGIGLAANQLGINKAVCIVNIIDKLYFINPKIVIVQNPILYLESCLSFPGKTVKTKRHSYVCIEADNIVTNEKTKWYGRMDKDRIVEGEKFTFDYYIDKNLHVLEAVTIQHEISHLMGLTMYDFQYKKPDFISDKRNSPGRNDKIIIEKNDELTEIKYKFFDKWKSDGWRIKDGQINI